MEEPIWKPLKKQLTKVNKPLVSICIPTYNGTQFIAEAMDSAIQQTYPNLEIVVSDDTSSDDTLNIIETYKTKTEIPIHIYHHKRAGIGDNWNNCIKNANGEYIKFLFQDDLLEPNCIEKMATVLNSNVEVALVASKRVFIVDLNRKDKETERWVGTHANLQNGLKLSKVKNIEIITKKLFNSHDFFNAPLNKIGEPSAFMFKKSCVEKMGYFKENLEQILDYEFCCRLLKHYDIAIIDEPLVKFRLHNLQASQINFNRGINEKIQFEKLMFKNFFWYMNNKQKLNLFKKHSQFGRFLVKIKAILT